MDLNELALCTCELEHICFYSVDPRTSSLNLANQPESFLTVKDTNHWSPKPKLSQLRESFAALRNDTMSELRLPNKCSHCATCLQFRNALIQVPQPHDTQIE